MPGSGVRCVWLDLLVGPVSLVLALLFSLLVPVHAHAQTSTGGVSPVLNGSLENLVARIVLTRNQSMAAGAATSAGLQVAEAGTAAVSSGAATVGTVAISEMRVVSLAAIAGRAVTATVPGAIALIAADLAIKGITQCLTSPNGWCKPGQVNANQPDTGFNGYQWLSCAGQFDSPIASAHACLATHPGYLDGGCTQNNPSQWSCIANDSSGNPAFGYGVSVRGTCVTNYVVINGVCAPDPNANVPPQPIQYPELASNLSQVLSGNPNRSKDYWGIMSPADWYAAVADPSTQALPAQIVNPSNGQVAGPRSSSTSSAGTTTTQTNYTVAPNTDGTTLATNPVTLTTTTTTTNPDGTTTTTTTMTPVTDGGGSSPQPQPASAPIPCGLGTSGSPKCQIDETGTPTKADATTAMATPDAALQSAEKTAESNFTTANQGRSWTLTMPHILPGGSCQPIEWFSWGTWRGSWDVCTQLQYVRDLLAWLWPVLSAVYVWNKTASANAGIA